MSNDRTPPAMAMRWSFRPDQYVT